MLRTAFTDLTGCAVPIQQAPMGPISSAELAAAVAGAGGVGTITGMGMTADDLAAQFARFPAEGVLAVNFVTADIDPDVVACAGERFRIVEFFWRDPDSKLVGIARRGGALVGWQVGSVAEARQAVDAGVDVLAVQGMEAGGHVRGRTALLPLLESVLDEVTVPVLAAGAIAGPRSLAAVLAAGAAGARIGTRFIATTESGAHQDYVAALVAAGSDATEITDGFAECPLCASEPRARVLRSAIAAVDAFGGDEVGTMVVGGEKVAVPKRAGLPPHRGVDGHVEAMALYAGQGVAAVTSVRSAGDVVRELAEGAERLLNR